MFAQRGTGNAEAARALANRAACWLPLERYDQCLSDCRAALSALLPLLETDPRKALCEAAGAMSAAHSEVAGPDPGSSASCSSIGASGAVGVAQPHPDVGDALHQSVQGGHPEGLAPLDEVVAAARQLLRVDGCSLSAPESGGACDGCSDARNDTAAPAGGEEAPWRAHVTAAARVAARMALASGCLKRGKEAAGLYRGARELYCLLRDEAQARRMEEDEQRMLGSLTC
jgi:hypothetical protein